MVCYNWPWLPMSRPARYAMFQLINRFYDYRSLIVPTDDGLSRFRFGPGSAGKGTPS